VNAPSAPRYGLSNAIYNDDARQEQITHMTYMGKSLLRLKFERVELEPKSKKQEDENEGATTEQEAEVLSSKQGKELQTIGGGDEGDEERMILDAQS
jgi:hypothetical protein